jgi:hypothetical protein
MNFKKLCAKSSFLVIYLLFEHFWICSLKILYIIKEYIYVKDISCHLDMYWERSNYLKF